MAKDPKKRPSVFKELFEDSTSNNEQVSAFLSEYIHHVFPENFLEGTPKNKKVLNKKIMKFVGFNRYETFTKITLLEKFKIENITWMRYNSNHKNAKYF